MSHSSKSLIYFPPFPPFLTVFSSPPIAGPRLEAAAQCKEKKLLLLVVQLVVRRLQGRVSSLSWKREWKKERKNLGRFQKEEKPYALEKPPFFSLTYVLRPGLQVKKEKKLSWS